MYLLFIPSGTGLIEKGTEGSVSPPGVRYRFHVMNGHHKNGHNVNML